MFLAFRPHPAAMPVDDALNDGKANPGSLVFSLTVKPVEDAEKLSVAFHVETGPVIPDTISVLSIVSYAADSNYGYFLLLRELDGIGQKVHHHLPDKPYVTVGGRERLS